MPASMHCPKCRRGHVHRSRRRNLFETVISAGGIIPFRCLGCDHRFFAFRLAAILRASQFGKS